MRSSSLLAALLCSALLPSLAGATEVEIANDRIGSMGMPNLNFGGQLIVGEAVSETFSIPLNYFPFQVTQARFMAGPSGMAKVTIVLYEDNGTPTPGKELARVTPVDEIEGNINFIQDVPFEAPVDVTAKRLRIAIFPQRDSDKGGIAIPYDPATPNLSQGNICFINPLTPGPCTWTKASTLGVKGPFILRLVGETNAVGPDDGGVTQDMSGSGGNKDMGGTVQPGGLTITSINPSNLPQDKGGKLVVLGGGFTVNTSVTLEGDAGPNKLANTLLENQNAINASVPGGLPVGVYTIVVQNPDGSLARLQKALTIDAASAGGCDASRSGREAGGGAAAGALGLLLCAALLRRRPNDARQA